MRSRTGETVCIWDIPFIENEAHMLSGSQSTSIFTFKRDLFTDLNLAPVKPPDLKIEEDKEEKNELDNDGHCMAIDRQIQ